MPSGWEYLSGKSPLPIKTQMFTSKRNGRDLPAGIWLADKENLLAQAQFGKQKMVYWLTSRRIIVASGGRRHHALVSLALNDCMGVRVEWRKRFLHKEAWIAIYSKAGQVWEDELTGRQSPARAAEWCAAVSNQLALDA